jgi:hypothetical protein
MDARSIIESTQSVDFSPSTAAAKIAIVAMSICLTIAVWAGRGDVAAAGVGASTPPPQSECSYPSSTQGYLQATALGDVLASGSAVLAGTMMDHVIYKPVVGLAETPTGSGYWETASDGGIFAFGDALFHGSMGGRPLNKPIVGMAATADGGGYWEVASDGGIFAFGDALFHGSMGGQPLNQPIVGVAAMPSGDGYWETASDGGIFSFGDAGFHGSMGGQPLNQPVVGMAASPDGGGYWLTAADGGIFNFGSATFQGSFAGGSVPSPVVGIVARPAGAVTSPPVPASGPAGPYYGNSPGAAPADYYYAGAFQFATVNGASFEMCAAQQLTPALASNHSLTELAAANGNALIEIGAEASSQDYGSQIPHLFVARRSNDGVSHFCGERGVELIECGLIQVPSFTARVNMTLSVGTTMSFAVEHFDDRWNLYYDGQLFGYFPDTLWNGSFAQINEEQVFGEVAAQVGALPTFIMGNGIFGSQPGADRVTGYQLLGTQDAAGDFAGARPAGGGVYDISATATSFAYGGPGN